MQDQVTHTVTEQTLELLRARRVYHKHYQGDRWQPGTKIGLSPATVLEPYCSIWRSNVLPLRMGAFSYAQGELQPHVSIGRYCSLGMTLWMGDEHPTDWVSGSSIFYDTPVHQGLRAFFMEDNKGRRFGVQKFDGRPQPIIIGNDVWIGDQAMIKGGVTIGDGAVIGARATVTKDVPPYAVVVGTPARIIRWRFDEATIARLLALKWWRLAPDQISELDISKPELFLDRLEALAASGAAPEMVLPPSLTGAEILAA